MPPLDDEQIIDAQFGARDLAWSAVADLFDEGQEEEGLTYKCLGGRIGRSKSQVQRWLHAPHNMSLQSLGLLAEGLDADLVIELRQRIRERWRRNALHPSDAAAADLNSAFLPGQDNYRDEKADILNLAKPLVNDELGGKQNKSKALKMIDVASR